MTGFFEAMPPKVQELIRKRTVCEYATISKAGVPIDTPTYYFPAADLSTIDIGTGMSYPVKADRARNNPKVGLLIEGAANEPVISVSGMAAVRDADIQANLERYMAETILSPTTHPELVPWENTRQRHYYLSRIIVCVAPARIRWWPNRDAAQTGEPTEWRAPADAQFPESDPAPPGKPTPGPDWRQRTWQELAARVMEEGMPAHLTLVDGEGFPLPLRVVDCRRVEDGFAMRVPRTAPWREGKATLSFVGKEIFVGDAIVDGDETLVRVERVLPSLPTVDVASGRQDEVPLLYQRLRDELDRRGLPLPIAPEAPPQPTEGCLLRAAEYGTLDLSRPAGGVYDN